MQRVAFAVALLSAFLSFAAPSQADDWLPHPADATWTYSWTDSAYNTTPTKEKVTVKDTKDTAFSFNWTTDGLDNSSDAPSSTGTVWFQEGSGGILNVAPGWSSNAPPTNFPILCARIGQCGNSLASTYYNLIWGTRVPVLAEPLLKGLSWSSTGGAQDDVTSATDYLGTESITVPAFDQPVVAAKVRSEVTQAGALGDPYGSGVRTVWWVYGVGPVKVLFEHSGGASAPVTTSILQSTNQKPKAPPGDANYFPLTKGLKGTYRWTNPTHLKKPVVESFSVDQVVNGSARISLKSVSGPIKVAAAYGFTSRLDGVTNVWGITKAASLAKLPPLGPKSAPADKRRHFFTPFDLMTYGFNPLVPAYPNAGDSWAGTTSGRDYAIYGATGAAKILGVQKVKVPAGSFNALAIRTTLKEDGFPWGSGTRTSWFVSGKGLVKLVFQHADKSVSTVELLK